MHYGVHAGEHWLEIRLVSDVALHQLEASRQPFEPDREIVTKHDFRARTPQSTRRMTAYVACSARYPDRQKRSSNEKSSLKSMQRNEQSRSSRNSI